MLIINMLCAGRRPSPTNTTMITYSGGGPAFLALPPKRSNQKSPLSPACAKSNPSKAGRSAPLPLDVASTADTPDPARQIESMLNTRPRTSKSQNRTANLSLSGIEDGEWTGFTESHGGHSESSKHPALESARNSLDLRDEGMHSFYTPGSSTSSLNTIRLSMDEQRPPITPKSPKTAASVARKFLRRSRPQSHSRADLATDSSRRDSLEYPPPSSLNASHRLHEKAALTRSNSGRVGDTGCGPIFRAHN